MSYYNNQNQQPAPPIGFNMDVGPPPSYSEAITCPSGPTPYPSAPVSASAPPYPAGGPSNPGYPPPCSATGVSYPSHPNVAPIQGSYVPPANSQGGYNSQPTYDEYHESRNVYSNYSPAPPSHTQHNMYSNYSPPSSSSHHGGGHSKGGNVLKDLGDFASRNKMALAGAAVSYKMGGGLGKMFAAGTAANLAHNYQQEQKYKKQQNSSYRDEGGGMSSSSSHGYGGSTSSQVKGIAGDLLHAGQGALGQAKKYAGNLMQSGGHKSLKSGYVIQLISQVTGRTLQIVKTRDNRLVLDAMGMEGPQAFNTHFTVVKEQENVVMLHNNFNYIAIMNGQLCICSSGQNVQPPPQSRLVVHEGQPKTFSFESAVERGQAIGMQPNGEPRGPGQTDYRDYAASFVVNIIHKPY